MLLTLVKCVGTISARTWGELAGSLRSAKSLGRKFAAKFLSRKGPLALVLVPIYLQSLSAFLTRYQRPRCLFARRRSRHRCSWRPLWMIFGRTSQLAQGKAGGS